MYYFLLSLFAAAYEGEKGYPAKNNPKAVPNDSETRKAAAGKRKKVSIKNMDVVREDF